MDRCGAPNVGAAEVANKFRVQEIVHSLGLLQQPPVENQAALFTQEIIYNLGLVMVVPNFT